MKWRDVDLDAGEWKYCVSKTKTDHLVPLARQAVAILRDLYPRGREQRGKIGA
jgi:integrase